MNPRTQTVALAAIGIADLISTLYFIGLTDAAEANPFMARFLERGPATFILAKLLLLLAPLLVIELARRKNPAFVRRAVNTAIVLYVGLYAVGVAHINRPSSSQPAELSALSHSDLESQRAKFGLPPGPPLLALMPRPVEGTALPDSQIGPPSPVTGMPSITTAVLAGVDVRPDTECSQLSLSDESKGQGRERRFAAPNAASAATNRAIKGLGIVE